MILSDRSINEAIASGRLGIEPFDPKLVQPSSIDVRLDNKFLVFRNTKRAYIDVKQPADELMELIEVGVDEPMFLHPHEFVLGSTIERVKMPDDLVGRLEGRSSLGRLGVVIHSSLPYDAPVLFRNVRGVLDWRPIGELVENRLPGWVVGFDQDTFEVAFHQVTNWFRELPDKIYEVRLASGRNIHVTAGHNLFTVDRGGNLVKTATRALGPGSRVAVPKAIPKFTPDSAQHQFTDLGSVGAQNRVGRPGRSVDASAGTHVADEPGKSQPAGTSAATLENPQVSSGRHGPTLYSPAEKLTRLVTGGLEWEKVAEVIDTGRFEVVYDLEVRPPGTHVQNFLAGHGGIFASNTAGFIDASFEGHVTLEISNLANLPIALYPGMRIGQISFSLMTTPADKPYGAARGSKYSGQQLPTASRLYLDFQP